MRRFSFMAGALVLGGWLNGAAQAQEFNPQAPSRGLHDQIFLVGHLAEAEDKAAPEAKPAADAKPVAEAGSCGQDCGCKDKKLQALFFGGFDGWRGMPDQDWPSNFGLHIGGNAGLGLVGGLGAQAGFRYIGYDWDGRLTSEEQSSWATELFLTTGFFKRADIGMPFTAAVVIDFLVSDNFGVAGDEPHLQQWRVLLGKPIGDHNEVGFWGAIRDSTSQHSVPTGATNYYTAVSRYNVYWKHLFASGAESMLYAGVCDDSRHGLADGSLGTWSIGLDIQAPISDRVALYANFDYMRASANTTSGPFGNGAAFEMTFNVTFGVAFYPCFNLRDRCSISRRGWLPVLPVASNGTFMVDFGGND